MNLHRKGELDLNFSDNDKKSPVPRPLSPEGPCRHIADAVNALNLPPNFSVEEAKAGCCGMAGSFGFEKEHYDVSMTIGSQKLFPH